MAKTQKNKATNYHLGTLKAKLAKLRTQLNEGTGGGGPAGEGFEVEKHGHARVAMIGFPSVGKSSMLNVLTKTESLAAAYEFTTLTCIPGFVEYRDSKIQLLDLPGIIEGASGGKGRGRQVIAVGKSADLILMVLDVQKAEEQRVKLTRELESVGIRLNKERPRITITKQKGGGVMWTSIGKLTNINEKAIKNVCQEYKIHNALINFGADYDVDALIDAIEGNVEYIKCMYVYNKIDICSIEDIDMLAREDNSCVVSMNLKLGLDSLQDKMWEMLDIA